MLEGSIGPTPQNAAMVGQPRGIDYAELIRQGLPPALVKSLAESQDYGKAKVARTVETVDASGRPITIQVDEFGKPVGEGMRQ